MDDKKERATKILAKLHELFPDAKTELVFQTPFQLLVAVILSAQCTDKTVNRVTESIFRSVAIPSDLLPYDLTQFDKLISSVTFHQNKAKNILATAKILEEKFGGEVPQTLEELVTLPGVARKTANVVLHNVYGKNVGIAVDTHVIRLAQKLGLTTEKDPVKIEKDLMEILPQNEWGFFSDALILYGRKICSAKVHDCQDHPLTQIYPPAANVWPKK